MKPPKQPFPLFLQDSRLRKANVNETKKEQDPLRAAKRKPSAALRKGAHMIFTKHKKLLAFFVVLALAISLPAATLADADTSAPVATLYSPSANAAATANQKIIFSLSEKVSLVSGHSIAVSDGATTYTADAASGTLVGDATSGPWYAVYSLASFTNAGTPLTLAVSTTYNVSAEAGAFQDLASNPSAAASGSFATADNASFLAVVFTTSGAGQIATVDSATIVSGQAVDSGKSVAFTIPAQAGFDLHTQVIGGVNTGSFDPAGGTLEKDLEVYITRTAVAAKVPYSGSVTKPVALTVTDTSVVLTSVAGYEYMMTGGSWQDGTTFSGLTAGQSYDFYQRVKETSTTLASDASEKLSVKTTTPLTGTAIITGTAQSGKTLTGSLSGSNASGTINYVWQRGGATVGTGTTYLLGSADVGQVITLSVTATEQSGSPLTAATATVLKAENATVPAAPTMASATASTITLNTLAGYQYSLGGTYWQDTPTFHSLTTGAAYTFYQRVAETATTLASAPSAGANFSTLAGLTGTISTTGEARYGMTMTATLSGSNNTGTLTYTWKRGTTVVGTGAAYAVSAADISNPLSVEVTSTVQGGVVTKSLGTVAKAYYTGDAPDAPSRYSRSTSKIVLNTVSGVEYSRGGTTWQDSPSFSGLKSGTSYTFYQRYKATATTDASPSSEPYKTSTTSSSSSDDDTSATPSPKPGASSSPASALYSYTLTPDNTRILYSTMKSLAEGNKSQDVTIKQDDVEFTFAKGTMTDTYTQLWYDFGASINNSIAAQTAQEIAGDAYVATVHYNYNGELPAKANIRLNVGAAQAGKTLYYYLLNADKTLTFQQTAVVDNTGWATVSQTHCSDYVFLNRDINAVSPSPEPTPGASASPLPSPSVSPDKGNEGIGSDGWFIAAIVLIAVALIVGGIWLFIKNREDKMDDDEDDDNNNLF